MKEGCVCVYACVRMSAVRVCMKEREERETNLEFSILFQSDG